MIDKLNNKKCLLIADGPPPLPEHPRVEGGGLRVWGLAKGILKNQPDIEVTLAYHDRFKHKNFTPEYEGIKITTHSTAEDAVALIGNYDTIIISYCMGDLSVVVAENIRTDQQLVLDCNVPAYVEVSARDSKNIDEEYRFFNTDVERFSRVLRRGDLFLCASDVQKRYYLGVLSAVGRVNPLTYGQDLILVVPYGIYREDPVATRKPIESLIAPDKKSKKVLWFGGIYPWFDLRVLIDAIKKVNDEVPTKLIIVGAKNPFNGHPDFIKKYDELIEYISTSQSEELVAQEDWVDFNDRANWYLDSDAVVMINREGEENELAWRTRLVDYTWANIPILTNGGDPLGEMLIANHAAIRLTKLNAGAIAEQLKQLLNNPQAVKDIRSAMAEVKKNLYWDVVTKKLAAAIEAKQRAKDLAENGQFLPLGPAGSRRSKLKSIAFKAKQLPAYTKKHGARNTYFVLRGVTARRVSRFIPKDPGKHTPRVIAISHQLDISGAPFIIVDLVREMKELYPRQKIDFYTFNPAHEDQIKNLNKSGIRPVIYMVREAVPNFGKGDVVILNTIAHSPQLKAALYDNLEKGVLSKLLWYIHEDNPEFLFTDTEIVKIRNLMNQGKLTMFTAAVRTKEHYNKFFDTDKVKIQHYRVITPDKYHKVRQAKDFEKIDFLLTGVAADGRKGQLTIFYAFMYFLKNYYEINPKLYRDFSLSYIGLGHDLVSKQLRNHAEKGLGDRFKMYPVLSKSKTLDLTHKANFTICYSLLESLPLFVFEGMIMGHPIFRNDCSGIEEQLETGKNGLYLETKDFWQIVDMIEVVLNTDKTTNKTLASMSQRSYDIANKQEKNSYKPMIDVGLKALKGE